MRTAHNFRWLPNALTITRGLLAVPIFWLALEHAWVGALWLLFVALLTDFLDGLAAKKLGAQTALGAQLDPLADSALVAAGMVGLSLTGHLTWWVTGFVLLFGVTIGNERFFKATGKRSAVAQKVASVSCLFLAWTAIAWCFAGLAYGWSWWYVVLTLGTLVVLASFKRHRLRVWLGRSA